MQLPGLSGALSGAPTVPSASLISAYGVSAYPDSAVSLPDYSIDGVSNPFVLPHGRGSVNPCSQVISDLLALPSLCLSRELLGTPR